MASALTEVLGGKRGIKQKPRPNQKKEKTNKLVTKLAADLLAKRINFWPKLSVSDFGLVLPESGGCSP